MSIIVCSHARECRRPAEAALRAETYEDELYVIFPALDSSRLAKLRACGLPAGGARVSIETGAQAGRRS